MPEGSPVRKSSWLIAIGGFVAVTLAGALLWHDATSHGETVPSNRPVQAQEANYVTSDSCRACHPGNYASWHTSFHRTMTQVATPETLIPQPGGVELSFAGRQYKLTQQDGKIFVSDRSLGASEYGPPREVVLLTGSHTLQILWTETGQGRTLEQFPFAYIIAEKMWAPVTQTFLMPPETKEAYSIGSWNGACMDCHVTQGVSKFVEGNRWDSKVAEFGIACEACHSEGRDHIAANRNPLRRWKYHLTKETDPTIANARKMKGPESALACGQCHSVWAFKGMNEKIDFNRHGGKFRPGKEDLEQRFVVQPNEPDHATQKNFIRETEPDFFRNRFWGDGMIRVTGREMNGVQASPCFKGGDFSCISCHEMHPEKTTRVALKTWARNDQLAPKMESDQACLQCHKEMESRLTSHTNHERGSSGSSCYNCHMPHTTFGLLHAMRSHQVSSPNVRESLEFGRPNACNLCHLDQTLSWTANKLHDWYQQPVPELSEDDRTISAAVQWLVKGDAGQRALLAWGMGWEPAQKISGRDWLYPFLSYTLLDPYAAVRFDAWKSLQTLPGFEDFKFTYTADAEALGEAVKQSYQKWWNELRPANPSFDPKTVLDPDGRFQEEVFSRLRRERDETPIVLAE
ncbi:MAG: C cytochrome precursor [Verrucomicrobiota bacterium]|nr:C cytochrome precursor [Verrucomicrobiota bacterium]